MRYLFYIILIFLFWKCRNAELLSLERSNKGKIIVIQPLGDYDPNLLDTLHHHLTVLFDAEVKIFQSIPLPDSLGRKYGGKYPADSLLAILTKKKKGNVAEIVGVTQKEIFIPKVYKGYTIPTVHTVRGYGYISDGICIVSDYSLASQDSQLKAVRLFKAITHEVGHNIGLPHCITNECIMAEQSGDLAVLDSITGLFCAKCKRRAP